MRIMLPVLEVEADLTDSGAQSGSVSNSWLAVDFANGILPDFSKSKRQGQGISTLM